MNGTWSFYDTTTGLFTGRVLIGSDDQLVSNTLPGTAAIAGKHNKQNKKVDLNTLNVVDYQPPQPSPDYVWNATTKRWEEKASVVSVREQVRSLREQIQDLQQQSLDPMRELILDSTKVAKRARLTQIDNDIATLRAQIAALLP
jgi:hypothetical protein